MATEESETVPAIDMVSFDKIASKLIREGFLLTALELHAELIESGKELPRLRDFFSNAANFERNAELMVSGDALSAALHRTPSEQTFDSLDFTRNSDDGERQIDERIAVLEFELRKARETIKSLRASLTLSSANTEPELTHAIADKALPPNDDSLAAKPHEKRALNYLVNEYLMKYNYKLTSITFCDENEDQDFESWDDVGLNIPKPPDLIKLYRYFWWNSFQMSSRYSSQELSDSECVSQT